MEDYNYEYKYIDPREISRVYYRNPYEDDPDISKYSLDLTTSEEEESTSTCTYEYKVMSSTNFQLPDSDNGSMKGIEMQISLSSCSSSDSDSGPGPGPGLSSNSPGSSTSNFRSLITKQFQMQPPQLITPYQPDRLLRNNTVVTYSCNSKGIRAWFWHCVSYLTLKKGDYCSTLEEMKYSMWLFFTVKCNVNLRQLRADGLRKSSSHHANFSYYCKKCGKSVYTAKWIVKKMHVGENEQDIKIMLPKGCCYLTTLKYHPKSSCGFQNQNISNFRPRVESRVAQKDNALKDENSRLSCPHIFDLMKTIKFKLQLQNQQKESIGLLRDLTVTIMQDIYLGKAYDEKEQKLTIIKQSLSGKYVEQVISQSNLNPKEIEEIKGKKKLMIRMVQKRMTRLYKS